VNLAPTHHRGAEGQLDMSSRVDCGICTLRVDPPDGIAFLEDGGVAHVPCYIREDGAAAPLKDPSASDFLRSVHVLVVEDNEDTLQLIKSSFEYSGAFVTGAIDATSGKRLLREVVPHVIISDISMPDDGLELVAEVLAFGKEIGLRIPAIAITAGSDAVDHLRKAGFAAFIAKPLDPLVLTVIVERLARGRRVALAQLDS
jgi:CheY-like chemotaxis protein